MTPAVNLVPCAPIHTPLRVGCAMRCCEVFDRETEQLLIICLCVRNEAVITRLPVNYTCVNFDKNNYLKNK